MDGFRSILFALLRDSAWARRHRQIRPFCRTRSYIPNLEVLEDRITPVAPASFTVTNLLDDVPAPAGSLREAMNKANGVSFSSIVFAWTVRGTITLVAR